MKVKQRLTLTLDFEDDTVPECRDSAEEVVSENNKSFSDPTSMDCILAVLRSNWQSTRIWTELRKD